MINIYAFQDILARVLHVDRITALLKSLQLTRSPRRLVNRRGEYLDASSDG